MVLSLRLRRIDDYRLVLAVSPTWRLFFGFLGLILVAGMAAIAEFPIVLIVASVLCLGAAAYDDRWVFDRPRAYLRRKRGFGPLGWVTSYRLDDFSSVLVGSVTSPNLTPDLTLPSLLHRGRATLRLKRRDGTRSLLVEDGSHRDRGRLLKLGRIISDWSGIPLEGDA